MRKALFLSVLIALCFMSNVFSADKIGTFGAPNASGTYPMEVTDAKAITVASDATFSVGGAVTLESTAIGAGSGYVVQSKRIVSTIAEVNAGVTLLPAIAGRGYQLVNVKMIAVGGAVTSTNVTHLEVRGTQAASSAVLYKVAKAQLTQSAVNTVGTASTVVLANGASFLPCDANAAVTLDPLGGTDAATATYVQVIIDYIVQ